MNLIEHLTLQIATVEAALVAATAQAVDRRNALSDLQARAQAAQLSIAELRQTAASRSLSDTEAARFNIAVLDQQDLAGMVAAASEEAQSAAQAQAEAQRALNRLSTDLSKTAAAALRDALVDRARELEDLLTDCLTAAWLASKEAEPRVRFVNLWQPGAALRRAVAPNHMPPNGDVS